MKKKKLVQLVSFGCSLQFLNNSKKKGWTMHLTVLGVESQANQMSNEKSTTTIDIIKR